MVLIAGSLSEAAPLSLESLRYEVRHDIRILQRDEKDRRTSVWTFKASEVEPILKAFGIEAKVPVLQPGQIFAVFLNDRITEDLTTIVHNKTANSTFADYADSGIRFKLQAPEAGKKYTHLTAVIFTPIGIPSQLGMRTMQADGLSEKKE